MDKALYKRRPKKEKILRSPVLCTVCQAAFVPKRTGHKCCSALCLGRRERAENKTKRNAVAREAMRKRRAKFPERVRAINSKYRQKPKNRVRAAQKSREWHAEHTEYANNRRIVRKQMQRVQKPWTVSVRGAQSRAKKKNLPFDLTYEWAEAVWTGRCELTGIPFSLGIRHSRDVLGPSVDKIDASKGYVQNNCRFVLHCINTFKYTGTDENMYRVAEALLANKPTATLREAAPAALSLPA